MWPSVGAWACATPQISAAPRAKSALGFVILRSQEEYAFLRWGAPVRFLTSKVSWLTFLCATSAAMPCASALQTTTRVFVVLKPAETGISGGEGMAGPEKMLEQAEGMLRQVIENLVDAQEGLQHIGDAVRDEHVKRFLLSESLARADFRGQLENILHQEGVRDVHVTGTPSGKLFNAWSGIKVKAGASEESLLEIAGKEEQKAIDAYHDALSRKLPRPILDILGAQVQRIAASHRVILKARQTVRAA
ncbi:DUF2383 domain-containing protein [Acidobacteria bacterium AB60]|nr:DUF2383 domain-containing protein [Acidobacteria bacterium AB60]